MHGMVYLIMVLIQIAFYIFMAIKGNEMTARKLLEKGGGLRALTPWNHGFQKGVEPDVSNNANRVAVMRHFPTAGSY